MASNHDIVEWAKQGDLESMKGALMTNPDLSNARDEDGVSALMWASYFGKTDVVEIILAWRTRLDIWENSAFGRLDALKFNFEEDETQLNDLSPDGFSAIGFAAYFGQEEIVDYLISRGAELNQLSQNHIKAAPLHSALSNGYTAIAKKLVEAGADVNLPAGEGWTPLHYCADLGDVELTKWMLEHGAKPGAVSSDGKSAAQLGRDVGHVEAAEVIENWQG